MSELNELEDKIMAFLSASPNSSFNFSEISRAVGKAPPTVKRAVERLTKKKKVKIIDKRSMKLVRLQS
jgi:Mn-dependent DtxR family transcriptional regulator